MARIRDILNPPKVKPMTDREALRLREQRVIELEETVERLREEIRIQDNILLASYKTIQDLQRRLNEAEQVLDKHTQRELSCVHEGRGDVRVPSDWKIVRAATEPTNILVPDDPTKPLAVLNFEGIRITIEKK
jgi:hypothetical protein